MPFGAILKAYVTGKVSGKSSYSSNEWRATSEDSCCNLHNPTKTFEAP